MYVCIYVPYVMPYSSIYSFTMAAASEPLTANRLLCSGATLRGRQCGEGYFAFALLQSKTRLIAPNTANRLLCSGATLIGRQCGEGYFAFALLQSKIRLIDYCVQVLRSEEGNAGKATSHSPSCSLKYG